MKIHHGRPPWEPFPLGPCPDDRARNSVQDSLIESSVRPNPTLVFSKICFQILTPQYRPKRPQKSTPGRAWGVYRPQKRKIRIGPVGITFFANRIYWIFSSGRYQPEKRKILIGSACIRFFRKQALLEFSFFLAGGFSLPYPDQRTKGWPPVVNLFCISE